MSKLTHYIIHYSATTKGRELTSDTLRQWHLGPHTLTEAEIKAARAKGGGDLNILKTGVMKYKGGYYLPGTLPKESIGGVLIENLGGSGRGWRQVGYADMIHIGGRIENLVPYNEDENVDPWEITNGIMAANELYDNARHLLYVGGGTGQDTRTPEQVVSMINKVKETIHRHPDILVLGHNQVDVTGCPGFDVPAWLRSIGVEEKNISKAPLLYKVS